MSVKIIDETGVHDQVNVITVYSRPDNKNKSHFVNACISCQLLANYHKICGDTQHGQSEALRKLFYLHLFARGNKNSFLSSCFAHILSVLLSQPEVKSKRKNVFST